VLLDALARLDAAAARALRVWFIGGETGSLEHARWIRAEVERRGLGSVVRFEAPTLEIAAVMRRLDAIVLPSRFEGFPNILLEAMASGLPSIATAVGNVPEMIEEGVTGFLVPPNDASALAAAIARLCGCPREVRREMGRRARRVVEERYRIEEVAARHLALYERLAVARRTRSLAA
jgi:glycosyltransferase involved in cell wall biosynthesis